MAEITGGILKDAKGHLGKATIYQRNGKTFIRETKIHQPHRLSRKQLVLREQIAHNNILWRRIKTTRHTYFEGGVDAYRRFMSVNTLSPTVYLTKQQLGSNMSLLLPNMAVSSGPLTPIRYQFDDVDGQSALLTDLTSEDMRNGEYLLYILRQKIIHWHVGEEHAQVDISAVPVAPDQNIEIPNIGNICLVNVPSKLRAPHTSKEGSVAIIGDIFADPMMGFALVHIQDGHVSSQHIVTRCTYYERYTTEEALQAAAKSYDGLTGE
jgi:hypothetical protein